MVSIEYIIEEAWLKFEDGQFLFSEEDDGVTFVKLGMTIEAYDAGNWTAKDFRICKIGPSLSDVQTWEKIDGEKNPGLKDSAVYLVHGSRESTYVEDAIRQELED